MAWAGGDRRGKIKPSSLQPVGANDTLRQGGFDLRLRGEGGAIPRLENFD